MAGEQVFTDLRKHPEALKQGLEIITDVTTRFAEEAIDAILHRAVTLGQSVTDICQQVSADYDYALRLIMDKTGAKEFIITREAIEDPENFINDLIRSSYGSGHFAIPGPQKK